MCHNQCRASGCPGLVQNTEVQLSCMRVRIGSLLAQSVGQVRVKADQSSGIHFTVKSTCGISFIQRFELSSRRVI